MLPMLKQHLYLHSRSAHATSAGSPLLSSLACLQKIAPSANDPTINHHERRKPKHEAEHQTISSSNFTSYIHHLLNNLQTCQDVEEVEVAVVEGVPDQSPNNIL